MLKQENYPMTPLIKKSLQLIQQLKIKKNQEKDDKIKLKKNPTLITQLITINKQKKDMLNKISSNKLIVPEGSIQNIKQITKKKSLKSIETQTSFRMNINVLPKEMNQIMQNKDISINSSPKSYNFTQPALFLTEKIKFQKNDIQINEEDFIKVQSERLQKTSITSLNKNQVQNFKFQSPLQISQKQIFHFLQRTKYRNKFNELFDSKSLEANQISQNNSSNFISRIKTTLSLSHSPNIDSLSKNTTRKMNKLNLQAYPQQIKTNQYLPCYQQQQNEFKKF